MPTLLNGASSSERLSAIRRGYDRCLQTEYDSKGLNRRLLSGGELSYPENQEWFDHIQSAPGNLFATALMTLPSPKKIMACVTCRIARACRRLFLQISRAGL